MGCVVPPRPWDANVREFAAILEAVARDAGELLPCTSWFRGPRFQGDQSQHIMGLAVDLRTRQVGGGIAPLRNIGRTMDVARAHGLVAILESDHLHVQRFRKGFRPFGVGFSQTGASADPLPEGATCPGCPCVVACA